MQESPKGFCLSPDDYIDPSNKYQLTWKILPGPCSSFTGARRKYLDFLSLVKWNATTAESSSLRHSLTQSLIICWSHSCVKALVRCWAKMSKIGYPSSKNSYLLLSSMKGILISSHEGGTNIVTLDEINAQKKWNALSKRTWPVNDRTRIWTRIWLILKPDIHSARCD